MAKTGRPSKYEPKFCDMLQEHFQQGYSFESFGGVAGVSKQTLYNWCDEHEEFLDAKRTYETASQLEWEKRLRSLATTGEGNATAIIFGLKNRASDSWRDMKATELSGPNGEPIKQESKLNFEGLSEDQLRALASIKLDDDNG